MPHSEEAEQKLLGCILVNIESLHYTLSNFPNAEELFYDMRHAVLFKAISDTGDIDPLRLQEVLRSRGQLESIGGMPFISSLMNLVLCGSEYEVQPIAATLANYLARRKMIEAAHVTFIEAYKAESAPEALAEAERRMMAIGESFQSDTDPSIKSLVLAAMDQLEDAHQNKGKIRGLETGFRVLDRQTGGFKPGQMIVIAARPAVGKTSLAMNIAEHVAIERKLPVGVFSLEMTGAELVYRMACSRARVDSRAAQEGELLEGDFARLSPATGAIAKAPLHICEKSGLTIAQISARARRMHRRFKLKLLVIDYLQLVSSRLKAGRNEQVTEISNGIKTLAKDLKIPVIVLSQLSRSVEQDDREPRLSDLRESGAIEQDADMVLMLHPTPEREKDGSVKDPASLTVPVSGLLLKHRGGPTGIIKLVFLKSLTRFETSSPVSDSVGKFWGELG